MASRHYALQGYNLSMNDILSHLDKARQVEWGTKYSLVVYSVVAFVVLSGLLLGLGALGVEFGTLINVLVVIVGEVAVLVAWVFKWSRLYDPDVMSVGFAVKARPESRQYYNDLKTSFRRSIDELNLTEVVKIQELPSDITFTDKKAAEQYISNKGLRVLFWGDAMPGSAGDGVEVTRFNLRVSYQHGPIPEAAQKDLQAILATENQRVVWDIQKTNTFGSMDIVAGNVLEMSLYSLGLCLATVRQERYVVAAVAVLERLHAILASRQPDANFPNLMSVKARIVAMLKGNYQSLRIYYYNDQFKLDEAWDIAQRNLALTPNDFGSNQDAAVLAWLRGEKTLARQYTAEAHRINPRNPLVRINLAFFDFCDGKYSAGLIKYKNIKKKDVAGLTNMVRTVNVILEEYDATHNPALLFAAGWLNIHFSDSDLGRSELTDFMSEASNDAKYKVLCDEANRLLGPSAGATEVLES